MCSRPPLTTSTFYHATSLENAEKLIESQKFRLPTRREAIDRGLKLGAAVYFGKNADYCIHEAVNTMMDLERGSNCSSSSGSSTPCSSQADRSPCEEAGTNTSTSKQKLQKQEKKAKYRKMIQEKYRIVCLSCDIDAGTICDFGSYDDRKWPECLPTLPKHPDCRKADQAKKSVAGKRMKQRDWDKYTELIDLEYLREFGYDSIVLNRDEKDDGAESAYAFEIAVYDVDRIKNIRMADVGCWK
ncbi:unnamed protein product [Amoebophrya sp. A120]|nr:unnamed protein product [Amoebophrya sp. A120]|eukprot:GSA120T00013794001.1